MAFNGLKIVCLCKCVLRGRWLLPVQLPHRSRNQALHCSVKHLGMQWHSQGVQTNLMSPGNTSCLELGTAGAVLDICSLWSAGKGSSNPPVKGQRVVQVCSTDYTVQLQLRQKPDRVVSVSYTSMSTPLTPWNFGWLFQHAWCWLGWLSAELWYQAQTHTTLLYFQLLQEVVQVK